MEKKFEYIAYNNGTRSKYGCSSNESLSDVANLAISQSTDDDTIEALTARLDSLNVGGELTIRQTEWSKIIVKRTW